MIGVLVIAAGRTEDANGAMAYLGDGFGHWLLVAMAGGFAGYGLWRLADAALAIESEGAQHEALKRAGAAVSGIVHLYLANKAFDAAEGAARLSGNDSQEQAQVILQMPGGQALLAAIAVALAAAGAVQFVVAVRCSFLKHLSDWARESWVKWVGRTGYAARGAVFVIAAYFAGRAALADRSSLVGGLEQVLQWLSPPVSFIVAAGLMLFGVYGFVEAWQRRIHAIDAAEVSRRAANQFT